MIVVIIKILLIRILYKENLIPKTYRNLGSTQGGSIKPVSRPRPKQMKSNTADFPA